MQDRYFYPDKNTPVFKTGEGYKDYFLSSLLPGYTITDIDADYYRYNEKDEVLFILKVAVRDNKGQYYYADFYPYGSMGAKALTPEALKRSTDAVIRIYEYEPSPGHVIQRMRWFSIFGRDFAIHTSSEFEEIYTCLHPEGCLLVPNAWTFHWGISRGYGLSIMSQYSFIGTREQKNEEMYFYPDDRIKPVEIGDGYKDYWLSHVLKEAGYSGEMECELRFARNDYPCETSFSYLIAVAHLMEGKSMVFSPTHYFRINRLDIPDSNHIKERRECAFPTDRFRDLRIRYYVLNGAAAQRPVWESAATANKHRIDERFYIEPGLIRVPGYHLIPYCYQIIEGPLLIDENDEAITNKILESPYIDYVE